MQQRQAARVSEHVPVSSGSLKGITLDVSGSGARFVARRPLPERFELTFELDRPLTVAAEVVWEQPVGKAGKVLGVRFPANARLAEWVRQRRSDTTRD